MFLFAGSLWIREISTNPHILIHVLIVSVTMGIKVKMYMSEMILYGFECMNIAYNA
jgi:hypothetical protein